jgi:hypothetical protein
LEGRANRYVTPDQVIGFFVDPPISFLLTRPVLSGDQSIESLKRVAAGAKKGILPPFFPVVVTRLGSNPIKNPFCKALQPCVAWHDALLKGDLRCDGASYPID